MRTNYGAIMRNVLTLVTMFCSLNALAVVPRYNIDPYSHWYTAEQTFAGGITVDGAMTFSALSDVSGDAVCVSSLNVVGTCAAAVFTTSVSSPILLSPVTGGADDILIKPAGTTAATFAETTGNMTLVGDLTVTGGDITALNMASTATGGADDMTLKPAGTIKFTVAEAGQIQINGIVSSHSSCASAGDRGKLEFFDDGADKPGERWEPRAATGRA